MPRRRRGLAHGLRRRRSPCGRQSRDPCASPFFDVSLNMALSRFRFVPKAPPLSIAVLITAAHLISEEGGREKAVAHCHGAVDSQFCFCWGGGSVTASSP